MDELSKVHLDGKFRHVDAYHVHQLMILRFINFEVERKIIMHTQKQLTFAIFDNVY